METRVLFVCAGNICRSPMAEAIFAHQVRIRGLEHLYSADSAGTGAWHTGEKPDGRTLSALEENGIHTGHRARQLTYQDFHDFQHIIAMDHDNLRAILSWPGCVREKVSMMLDWSSVQEGSVKDPYTGDLGDFHEMFVVLEEAVDALILQLEKRQART